MLAVGTAITEVIMPVNERLQTAKDTNESVQVARYHKKNKANFCNTSTSTTTATANTGLYGRQRPQPRSRINTIQSFPVSKDSAAAAVERLLDNISLLLLQLLLHTLIAVSDGGADVPNNYGSFGWVLGTNHEILWECKGIARGYPMQSYRAYSRSLHTTCSTWTFKHLKTSASPPTATTTAYSKTKKNSTLGTLTHQVGTSTRITT
jgi:hypothetical protein